MSKIIKGMISVLMIILSLIGILNVYKLEILPNIYIIGLVVIFIIFNSIGCLLLFRRGIFSKIISGIIYLILLVVSSALIYYGGNTRKYLDNSFGNNIEYTTYSVVTLKENNYSSVSDLVDTDIGYLYLDISDEYLVEVKNKVSANYMEYDLYSLYNKLKSKDISSIVINDGYIEILKDNFSDYDVSTKVIYSYKIEDKTVDLVDKEINLKSFNIYLSGSDSRNNDLASNSKSDVNMVITVNPITKKILLTSIPRDYYVQINGTTGLKDKLTHIGIYGTEKVKKTIEDLLGIKIDYTIKVGFNSVIEIVDLVGGIDIYSDTAFKSHCGDGGAKKVDVKVGMNHFNGAEALSYARERFAYSDGDVHRIKNQQQVIEAIVNKVLSDSTLLFEYDSLLNSISGLYKTDISSELVTLLIKKQITDMEMFRIEKQNLTGFDGSEETYSIPGIKLYVMYPDENSLKVVSDKILLYSNN